MSPDGLRGGGHKVPRTRSPWPGWPPRPSRAPWACEGRGEGPGQGDTADGHPPSGVARAVFSPPGPLL